jgi:hypothetical protein
VSVSRRQPHCIAQTQLSQTSFKSGHKRADAVGVSISTVRRLVIAIPFVIVILAAAGCAVTPKRPYEIVTPSSVAPGSAIPVPATDPILTFSGNIGTTNVGPTLSLDMPTLERLGLVTYSIDDPWRKERTVYTGVLVSDVLKAVAAPSSATSLHMTALDDYEVDLPIAMVQKYPILLATRADGKYMSIDSGGPTRIIYPYDTSPELDALATKDQLIWSIKSLEVR